MNNKLAKARFAIVLTTLAALCACVKAQESTSDYWMKKSQELESLEDGIKHTRYSITILIDHEKRMKKRAEEIRKELSSW